MNGKLYLPQSVQKVACSDAFPVGWGHKLWAKRPFASGQLKVRVGGQDAFRGKLIPVEQENVVVWVDSRTGYRLIVGYHSAVGYYRVALKAPFMGTRACRAATPESGIQELFGWSPENVKWSSYAPGLTRPEPVGVLQESTE